MEQSGQQSGLVADPDPFPLLPRGQVVFDDLPLAALIIEALAPALGHGQLVVRDGKRGAVILVRDGALVEVRAFSGGGTPTGEVPLADVQGWSDAVVSAHRLDAVLVGVCESLLQGEIIYTDLRLEWVDWSALLADFARRGGAYAVEIFTPAGRGVTCVAAGGQALSYTDVHPVLGDPALLGTMAANKEGTIQVRRLNAAAFTRSAPVAVSDPAAAASPTSPPASAAAVAEPAEASAESGEEESAQESPASAEESPESPPPTVAETPAAPPEEPAGEVRVDGASSDHSDSNGAGHEDNAVSADTEGASGGEARPGISGAPPWRGGATSAAAPIREVLGELRAIAQRRLQLSASPVQALLDDGARQGRSVDVVLAEIRRMSIRGVMPSAVESMVDEMSRTAANRHLA